MKKSLLIAVLSFFTFNLFGQKNIPEIIHQQHILNVGSGICFTSKFDDISPKPLLLVGYDYKAGFDLKRISNSRMYYSVGARFTNQFAQNTILNENLMYFTIPVGFVFEKSYDSNLSYNLQLGGNTCFTVNNDVVLTNYFTNAYVGFGCTFHEQFGIDFRYNFLGNGLEYSTLDNGTKYLPNNNYTLIFNYIIHQSSKENKGGKWWF